jgi:diguanylate cyclase (GGDEF)-like protein
VLFADQATSDLKRPRAVNAHRDALVLCLVIAAVLLLVWNGSAFFQHISFTDRALGTDIRVAATGLTLNIALILFSWRRYLELRHEAEMRAEGEHRAAVLATTDPITGLKNRKGFADSAEELSHQAFARGDQVALLSIQIHRFKVINDQHGYDTGDELLKRIAASLEEAVGSGTIIARLSGDEFAMAFAIASTDQARVDALARAALHAATRPFQINDRVVQVGAFAGIAMAGGTDVRIPDVLRRADIALNHAKNGRVARPIWFDAGMERALITQSEIEQGIRFGLEHGQFVPYFEPQVDLGTGEITGFEVLARWNHPLSGVLGASVFIPIAEESGLIDRLSEQVIAEALRQAAAWDPKISISVNISPSQFADGWLAQRIVRILTEAGFPASRLIVEITESSLFADLELARSIVGSLKNQGIRLALDDFGTGFSSLSSVRSLPFDMIKIDRSFVTEIDHKENMAIVRTVSTLASALSVPVCVEGIESERVYEAVATLGCAIGQGWYFGKPMTAEAARQQLDNRFRDDTHLRTATQA